MLLPVRELSREFALARGLVENEQSSAKPLPTASIFKNTVVAVDVAATFARVLGRSRGIARGHRWCQKPLAFVSYASQ